MNRFCVFLKKELKEFARSYKIIILPVLFLIMGLMSPLTAKFINEILKSVGGLKMTLPEPKYTDAYAQFFKNIGQMGIIVLILTFMGGVVEEKSKGSAVLVLTKGLSRASFIISKYLSYSIYFTASYAISALACQYYTILLFPGSPIDKIFGGFLTMWLFGMFILASTVFFSTISKNITTTAVYSILFFMVMSIMSALPRIGKFFPSYLASASVPFIEGTLRWNELYWTLGISGFSLILFLWLSVQIFKRQEI